MPTQRSVTMSVRSRLTFQLRSGQSPSILGDSNILHYLQVFHSYVPPKSAFVIAGAETAPRHQGATAIELTLLGLLFSLMTHVIGQHLAGIRVGTTNDMHMFAQSPGLFGRAAHILLPNRRDWFRGQHIS